MKLTLKEKLLLLSISNKTGWSYASNFSYALAGAIILELVENKKLILSENRLVIRNTKSTGDIILDDVIKRIRKKEKKLKIKRWVSKIGLSPHKYKKEIYTRLISMKVLEKKIFRFLGIIPIDKYLVIDIKLKDEFINDLRNLINGKNDDEELKILLSLLGALSILGRIFKDKEERKKAKKMVKEIKSSSEIGKAVDQTIREVNAAIIAAVTSSAAATAATSGK
ncbi:MAG: GPP34 family phosphoprotein [Bacteroidales bacterium]|nr:GPP34 family phosphoprotein [Bacteroidales bacterium]